MVRPLDIKAPMAKRNLPVVNLACLEFTLILKDQSSTFHGRIIYILTIEGVDPWVASVRYLMMAFYQVVSLKISLYFLHSNWSNMKYLWLYNPTSFGLK